MSGVNTISNKFNYDSNLFTPFNGVNYFNKELQLSKSFRVYDDFGSTYIQSTSMIHIHGFVNKNIATNILSYCKIYTNRGDIYVPLSPFESIDQFEYILFADTYNENFDIQIEYYDKSEESIDKPKDVYIELYFDVYSM